MHQTHQPGLAPSADPGDGPAPPRAAAPAPGTATAGTAADTGAGCRDWSGHVIVCGLDGVGLRTVEQLHATGEAVVVVDAEAPPRAAAAVAAWGVPHLRSAGPLPEVLAAAGLAGAHAVVCVEREALRTLETALLIRDLRPDVRIVVQLDNPSVGRAVAAVTGRGSVLDVAGLSAPSVVEACLRRRVHELSLAGERFVVARVAAEWPTTLRHRYGSLAPLGVLPADGGGLVVCPGRDHPVRAGDEVTLLGTPEQFAVEGVDLGGGGAHRPRAGLRGAARLVRSGLDTARRAVTGVMAETDRALRLTLLTLLAVGILSAVVLRLAYREPSGRHLSGLDAVYFTMETVATVGFGDFSFSGQRPWLELYGVVLIILGATLLTTTFALVTNLLVDRRIAAALGRQRLTRLHGHVVLVGLGAVGMRVLEGLRAAGQQVVAVERDEASRHLAQVRALGVPVVIGDATVAATLAAVNLDGAAAVAVMTSDDLTNLEIALAVRDRLGPRWRRVPVVVRVFDRSLGRTLERGFGFRHVRSTSALAAPWFAGAALGLDVLSTFYMEREPFLVGRLTVAPRAAAEQAGPPGAGAARRGGGLAGLAMGELSARIRVVALRRAGDTGTLEHPPRRDTRFAPGDEAYVVGPYEEILRLLRRDHRAGLAAGG